MLVCCSNESCSNVLYNIHLSVLKRMDVVFNFVAIWTLPIQTALRWINCDVTLFMGTLHLIHIFQWPNLNALFWLVFLFFSAFQFHFRRFYFFNEDRFSASIPVSQSCLEWIPPLMPFAVPSRDGLISLSKETRCLER